MLQAHEIDLAGKKGNYDLVSIDQNGPGGEGSVDTFGNVWVKVGEEGIDVGPSGPPGIIVIEGAGSMTTSTFEALSTSMNASID